MSINPRQMNVEIGNLAAAGATPGELLAMLPEETLRAATTALWREIRSMHDPGRADSAGTAHLGAVIRVLRAELDGRV